MQHILALSFRIRGQGFLFSEYHRGISLCSLSIFESGILNQYEIAERDFNEKKQNIEIMMSLRITREDREIFHKNGLVSQYKRYEVWERDIYLL